MYLYRVDPRRLLVRPIRGAGRRVKVEAQTPEPCLSNCQSPVSAAQASLPRGGGGGGGGAYILMVPSSPQEATMRGFVGFHVTALHRGSWP